MREHTKQSKLLTTSQDSVMPSQPPNSSYLGKQNPTSLPLSQVLLLNMTSAGYGDHFGQFRLAVLADLLPSPCLPPAGTAKEQVRAGKRESVDSGQVLLSNP